MSLICYAENGVYQYTDKNGNLVISNKPKANSKRYTILIEELNHEKQALNDASHILAKNVKIKSESTKEYQERNELLNNTINEHQKNIKILNKQLGYAP